jgi:hypothetical protein
VATVEVFDPTTQQFTTAGNFRTVRITSAITALADGRLIAIGGTGSDGSTLSSSEIFSPATGASSTGPALNTPRTAASASTLLDGRVAVLGGSYPEGAQNGVADLASAEVIDVGANTALPLAITLTTARSGHVAVTLPDNNAILILGGSNAGAPLQSVELFQPWNNTLTDSATANLHQGGALAVASGVLTVAGGSNTSSVEQFGYATLKSDQKDYQPGQQVTLTGAGWQPVETVALSMTETPQIDGNLSFSVVADPTGKIVEADYYAPTPEDIGALYTVTAVDAKSQAQIRFADAGQPTQLAFSTAARSTAVGACSAVISIQSRDVTGTASAVSTDTVIALSSSSLTGVFYSDSTCSTVASSITLAATKSLVSVYYVDTAAGTPSVSIAETSGQMNGGAFLTLPAAQVETVIQVTPTITITSVTPASSTYGTAVTVNVTLAGSSEYAPKATGTVNVKLGGTVYGTITLSGGSGSITFSNLAAPGGNVTAIYSGDANYKTAVSGAVAITIAKATNSLTASVSPTPSLGHPYHLHRRGAARQCRSRASYRQSDVQLNDAVHHRLTQQRRR